MQFLKVQIINQIIYKFDKNVPLVGIIYKTFIKRYEK